MWIVRLALRRPYTFVVLALAIILVTPLVLMRTPTDIFPEINIPVVTIAWTYTGLSPLEMERRVTSTIERGATTMVNDIEHLESQSLPGMTIIKLFFHPRANISTALAQTAAATETMMKWLPPGATPPLVIIYSASTVPVIQIGLTSDTMSEQELFDLGTTYLGGYRFRGFAIEGPLSRGYRERHEPAEPHLADGNRKARPAGVQRGDEREPAHRGGAQRSAGQKRER